MLKSSVIIFSELILSNDVNKAANSSIHCLCVHDYYDVF